MMLAPTTRLPAYILPAGDVIQRRIDADKEAFRKLCHRLEYGRPMASYPLMPWMLHQEALYWRQVEKPQPRQPQPRPEYHLPKHRLNLELPNTFLGDLAFEVVNRIGDLYDCFRAAWRYSH